MPDDPDPDGAELQKEHDHLEQVTHLIDNRPDHTLVTPDNTPSPKLTEREVDRIRGLAGKVC